jgi:thiol-disulfide isomerase/thioredoxin
MAQTKQNSPGKDAVKAAEPASKVLKVGDKAPALNATKWFNSKPLKLEENKAYVVEFWATWCGPCKESIPHLNSLATKHKDVTFVGVAASERKPQSGGDNREMNLGNFIRAQGPGMKYPVAYDAEGEMFTRWMAAAEKSGIPCAFVVNTKGEIAYIGHPANDKFDAAVAKVADEAKKAAAEAKKKKSKKKEAADENTTDGAKEGSKPESEPETVPADAPARKSPK